MKVVTYVEAPDEATHYMGDLSNMPVWLKADDGHWWQYNSVWMKWTLIGYHESEWIKEIPND